MIKVLWKAQVCNFALAKRSVNHAPYFCTLNHTDKGPKLEFTEEAPSSIEDEQAQLELAAQAKCRAIEGGDDGGDDDDEQEEEEDVDEKTPVDLDGKDGEYDDNEIVFL